MSCGEKEERTADWEKFSLNTKSKRCLLKQESLNLLGKSLECSCAVKLYRNQGWERQTGASGLRRISAQNMKKSSTAHHVVQWQWKKQREQGGP